MIKLGKVIVEDSTNKESFINLIDELDLKPPVVVKPNWGFSVCYTEATILDWVLTALGGDALVVESYGWARTKEALETGGWGSFKRKDLRESDRWFLDYSGIGKVLQKHSVEYLNITEENWGNRTTDPNLIRKIIEMKHQPLEREEFYSYVPERLYNMRGCDLLSLAKVRVLEEPMYVSLAIKNLFGMIPGPSRGEYHGKKHFKLSRSIVDIYKVYDSLFNINGIVEAVFSASIKDGKTMKWDNIENLGFASASKDSLELDALVSALIGRDPYRIEYLNLAGKALGGWNQESINSGLESGLKIL